MRVLQCSLAYLPCEWMYEVAGSPIAKFEALCICVCQCQCIICITETFVFVPCDFSEVLCLLEPRFDVGT